LGRQHHSKRQYRPGQLSESGEGLAEEKEMAAGHWPASTAVMGTAMMLIALIAFAGCKKHEEGGDSNSTIVALGAKDINKDGSIAPSGLAKIDAQASAPSLTVAFMRTTVSDAALTQLAKYPNLRSVQAPRSPLSQAAIDRLKGAIPEVQVSQ
jgi:hypothetical protein